MATTTNYSWETPDDTDLVKDGAAAIRTLGSSIDTTTKALNPSTTLGDIEYRSSTANTNTRLPLGTAGQFLKVNSGATAPEWATVAAPASGLTKIAAASFSGVSSVEVDSVFSSSYDNYKIVIRVIASVYGENLGFQYRYAGPTTQATDYYGSAVRWNRSGTASSFGTTNGSSFEVLTLMQTSSLYYDYLELNVTNVGQTSTQPVLYGTGIHNSGTEAAIYGGTNVVSRTYTGFRLVPYSGNISGNYYVYGMAN